MTERKRAEAVALSGGAGSASFSGFGDFEGAKGSSSASAASPSRSSNQASPDSSPTGRSVAAKRSSILQGVSQQELLMQHRRSLAGLQAEPTQTSGAPSPLEMELEGVTLSRRHTYSQKEYDDGRQADVYSKLESFRAGFDEGEHKEADANDDDG
jgi:hypothetical protein